MPNDKAMTAAEIAESWIASGRCWCQGQPTYTRKEMNDDY